jgi:DNA-binding CsgD family transcriptional regulator
MHSVEVNSAEVDSAEVNNAEVNNAAEKSESRPELLEPGDPSSGLIIVEGPPGSGKTTLLNDMIRRLGPGRLVLTAGCGRMDSGYAFGLIGQLVEPVLADPEAAGSDDSLTLVRDALTEVRAEPGELMSGPLRRLQESVERLIRELARRVPLLICVDDIHWGDGPSLGALAHLARRATRQQVLIVVTRCPQVLVTAPDGLTELLLRPDGVRIQPPALDQAQVSMLIGSVLQASPRPNLTAFCHRVTRSNPQLLIELVRAIAETGAQPTEGNETRLTNLVAEITVRRAVELLRRQPDDVQDLVEILAVLGERGVEVAADLTQLEPTQVRHSIEELVKLGLLRHGAGDRPIIAGDRLRAAVRNGIPAAERDELRIRAGRALSVRGAPVEHVASVLQGTRPSGDPWVIEVLCEAAKAQMTTGYPEEVVGYLQRVLRERLEPRQRAELLVQLGTARLHGDPEAAGRHFREAVQLAGDRRVRAAALIGFCQSALLIQRPLDVSPELTEAIRDLSAIEVMTDADREAQLRLKAMLVIASDEPGGDGARPPDGAPGPASAAAPSSGGSPASAVRRTTPAECELLSAFALQISERGGSAEEAVGLALRAMAGTSLRDRDSHGLFVRSVSVLLYADQPEAAMQWASRMVDVGSHHRWRLFQLIGRCLRAEAAYRTGNLDLSLCEARAAFETTGITDRSAYHALALANLTRVLTELGRLEEAQGFLDAPGTALIGTPRARTSVLAARGQLLARTGDLDGALYDLLEAGRLLSSARIVNPVILPWRSQAAELYAELGNHVRARELADEELSLARAWGTPRSIGIALRARGKAEAGNGGLGLLEEAVRVLSGSSARLDLAVAHAELGTRYRMVGAAASARRALRNAAVIAEQCSAHALLARVRAELVLSGARSRATPQSGPAALTPSERRAAELAARGNTNRQVARLLSVSPNTVEVHLTNVYRKLAISSRTQLADALSAAADDEAKQHNPSAALPELLPGRVSAGIRRQR